MDKCRKDGEEAVTLLRVKEETRKSSKQHGGHHRRHHHDRSRRRPKADSQVGDCNRNTKGRHTADARLSEDPKTVRKNQPGNLNLSADNLTSDIRPSVSKHQTNDCLPLKVIADLRAAKHCDADKASEKKSRAGLKESRREKKKRKPGEGEGKNGEEPIPAATSVMMAVMKMINVKQQQPPEKLSGSLNGQQMKVAMREEYIEWLFKEDKFCSDKYCENSTPGPTIHGEKEASGGGEVGETRRPSKEQVADCRRPAREYIARRFAHNSELKKCSLDKLKKSRIFSSEELLPILDRRQPCGKNASGVTRAPLKPAKSMVETFFRRYKSKNYDQDDDDDDDKKETGRRDGVELEEEEEVIDKRINKNDNSFEEKPVNVDSASGLDMPDNITSDNKRFKSVTELKPDLAKEEKISFEYFKNRKVKFNPFFNNTFIKLAGNNGTLLRSAVAAAAVKPNTERGRCNYCSVDDKQSPAAADRSGQFYKGKIYNTSISDISRSFPANVYESGDLSIAITKETDGNSSLESLNIEIFHGASETPTADKETNSVEPFETYLTASPSVDKDTVDTVQHFESRFATSRVGNTARPMFYDKAIYVTTRPYNETYSAVGNFNSASARQREYRPTTPNGLRYTNFESKNKDNPFRFRSDASTFPKDNRLVHPASSEQTFTNLASVNDRDAYFMAECMEKRSNKYNNRSGNNDRPCEFNCCCWNVKPCLKDLYGGGGGGGGIDRQLNDINKKRFRNAGSNKTEYNCTSNGMTKPFRYKPLPFRYIDDDAAKAHEKSKNNNNSPDEPYLKTPVIDSVSADAAKDEDTTTRIKTSAENNPTKDVYNSIDNKVATGFGPIKTEMETQQGNGKCWTRNVKIRKTSQSLQCLPTYSTPDRRFDEGARQEQNFQRRNTNVSNLNKSENSSPPFTEIIKPADVRSATNRTTGVCKDTSLEGSSSYKPKMSNSRKRKHKDDDNIGAAFLDTTLNSAKSGRDFAAALPPLRRSVEESKSRRHLLRLITDLHCRVTLLQTEILRSDSSAGRPTSPSPVERLQAQVAHNLRRVRDSLKEMQRRELSGGTEDLYTRRDKYDSGGDNKVKEGESTNTFTQTSDLEDGSDERCKAKENNSSMKPVKMIETFKDVGPVTELTGKKQCAKNDVGLQCEINRDDIVVEANNSIAIRREKEEKDVGEGEGDDKGAEQKQDTEKNAIEGYTIKSAEEIKHDREGVFGKNKNTTIKTRMHRNSCCVVL